MLIRGRPAMHRRLERQVRHCIDLWRLEVGQCVASLVEFCVETVGADGAILVQQRLAGLLPLWRRCFCHLHRIDRCNVGDNVQVAPKGTITILARVQLAIHRAQVNRFFVETVRHGRGDG